MAKSGPFQRTRGEHKDSGHILHIGDIPVANIPIELRTREHTDHGDGAADIPGRYIFIKGRLIGAAAGAVKEFGAIGIKDAGEIGQKRNVPSAHGIAVAECGGRLIGEREIGEVIVDRPVQVGGGWNGGDLRHGRGQTAGKEKGEEEALGCHGDGFCCVLLGDVNERCSTKIWDEFGRILFSAAMRDGSVVGSFARMKLGRRQEK